MKLILIIVGSVVLLGLGGGGYYLINNSSQEEVVTPPVSDTQPTVQTTQPPATPSPVPQVAPKLLTKTETVTAKVFVERMLKLIQNKDYGKVWDLLSPESKKIITRSEYVKQFVESAGNYNITSFAVKDVNEETNGASVQWVIRYSNNPLTPEETAVTDLVKINGNWFIQLGGTATSYTIINKQIGDEVVLATLKFKINASEERTIITSTYSNSVSAKENSKFVFVDMTITNITNTPFTFPATDSFALMDSSDRQFKIYTDEPIVYGQEYLTGKDLPPGINRRGWIVFEAPNDATSYGIAIGKSGTDDLYKVILK